MHHPCVRLTALLLLLVATRARASTFDWSNASGGTFGLAANWTPVGGPPNSNDIARFSLPNTYTATFVNSATVNTLSQTQGDVTLNLNLRTFAVTNTTDSGMGSASLTSTLHILGGPFNPGGFNIANVAGSTSNLYLDTGSVTTVGNGAFNVGSAGTGYFTLQNGATLKTPSGTAIGLNSSAIGAATVAGTGSTWTVTNFPLRVGSSGTGTLNILAGGLVDAFGLEVGENFNSVGTVSLSGASATFTTTGTANIGGTSLPAASATLNIGTGATMTLGGTTNLRTTARVNILGGRLNLNTVNLTSGALINWSSGTVNFTNGTNITTSLLDALLAGTHTLGANRTLSATTGAITLASPLVVDGGTVQGTDIQLNANIDLTGFSTIAGTQNISILAGRTV